MTKIERFLFRFVKNLQFDLSILLGDRLIQICWPQRRDTIIATSNDHEMTRNRKRFRHRPSERAIIDPICTGREFELISEITTYH